MKLSNKKFNDQDIAIMPTKTTEMSLGEDGQRMAIEMFTKNQYSNPVGSVVREIASNAVDSHVEEGVENIPIKIRLLYEESGVYVSIQDFGVGMNPERIERVYSRYFESTKRDNNDEIGGFGIGGKSVLAYADSFFVITVANKIDDVKYTTSGIKELEETLLQIQSAKEEADDKVHVSMLIEHLTKLHGTEDEMKEHIAFLTKRLNAVKAIKEDRVIYHYNIFKGENAPVIQELYFEGTTNSRGSEIKIPIKKDDISKFAREIKRQLYYFNNVVFEGWGGEVTDDYTIYKGKTFTYRGNDYETDIHVCLGNVAYPIKYSDLNLSHYDYNVPVAITLNIGDVEVTPSRESLQYSDKTIEVLTKKLKEVKEELVEIYSKQVENIISLEDYLCFKNEGRSVKLGNDMVNIGDFVSNSFIPKNFKYAQLNIKDNTELFELAYNHHKVSITKRRGSFNPLSYSYLINKSNFFNAKKIFHSKNGSFTTNNYKKLYIKKEMPNCNQGHVVVTKRDLKTISDTERRKIYSQIGIIDYNQWEDEVREWNVEEKKAKRLVNSVVKDLIKIVEKYTDSYDFEAPHDFVENIKASRRRKKSNGDTKLSIRDYAEYEYACEINLSALRNFRGRIFYSLKEDEDYLSPLKKAKNAHMSLFKERNVCKPYSDRNSDCSLRTGLKKSIMFIRIRKNQIHHFEKLKNAFHANDYYKVVLSRKHDDFVSYLKKRNLNNLIMNLPSLLKNPDIANVDVKIGDAVKEIEGEANSISTSFTNNSFDSWYGLSEEKLSRNLKINVDSKECATYKSKNAIEFIKNLQEKNEDVFSFINADSNTPFTDKLVMLLDLALER